MEQYISGTSFLKPRGKAKGETNAQYIDFLTNYYESALVKYTKYRDLVDSGLLLIYPQRRQSWEDMVSRHSAVTSGLDAVEEALTIMELLDSDAPLIEVKNMLETFEYSYAVVDIVLRFSKRGPEFFSYLNDGFIPDDYMKEFIKISDENNAYESALMKKEDTTYHI